MTDAAVKAELKDIASFAKWAGMPNTSFAADAATFETGDDRERYLLAASCAAEDVYRAVLEIDPCHPALPVLSHVQVRLNVLWVEETEP